MKRLNFMVVCLVANHRCGLTVAVGVLPQSGTDLVRGFHAARKNDQLLIFDFGFDF
jgi:hypothetical protein